MKWFDDLNPAVYTLLLITMAVNISYAFYYMLLHTSVL